MSDKYWVTSDKKRILLKDMETRHLYNCVAMFERRARDFVFKSGMDMKKQGQFEAFVNNMYPIRVDMIEEIERRTHAEMVKEEKEALKPTGRRLHLED